MGQLVSSIEAKNASAPAKMALQYVGPAAAG